MMRRIFGVAALALFGCGAPASSPVDGGATPPSDPPPASPRLAYFVLQDEDIGSATWPDAFRKYATIVVNPSIDSTRLARAFADLPDATFLAYLDAQNAREPSAGQSRYWN